MPEYTLRPGNPASSNWNCKRCWKSNSLSPYESKDKQLKSIIEHVKAKYVIFTSPSLPDRPRDSASPPTSCTGMASINRVKMIISSI